IQWPVFETQRLSDVYFSEGANAGDVNGDGNVDVVCGPYWYEGPDFKRKHAIYEPLPQNRDRYADSFFSWIFDFNGDGHSDVLAVGFPGTPAFVYENPGVVAGKNPGAETHWKKHEVLDWVSNESPQFVDLVGDATPELVCTRDGFFGFAMVNPSEPLATWAFYPISEQIAPSRFGHGLGVGDINGDQRADLIFSGGWFEQPAGDPKSGRWRLHEQSFSNSYGGADMHAYDVDGDGDNDVITSHAAHDFGLGWYEQVDEGGEPTFKHHLIMGDRPSQNAYGVVISELHSVNLADIDGDGLKDIVTGKTFWSHHRKSPMWDADPVVYWFRLQRTDDGVDWVPYQAASQSGIGRQLSLQDVDSDGFPDIIVGGMKGAFLLHHRRQIMSRDSWKKLTPTRYVEQRDRSDRGELPSFSVDGKIEGAVEAEAMKVLEVSGGEVRTQEMSAFKSGRWSGDQQLFWLRANPRSRLTLEFEVSQEGRYEIGAVLTTARDYATINLQLDGIALGSSIDLYDYPDVKTTGLLKLGPRSLSAGKHRLMIETTGANDSAIQSFMVGLDCLVLRRD
ncbi:MAG: FG-GAP repeat domain-containing protein, partial [Rubripirellula sp.]